MTQLRAADKFTLWPHKINEITNGKRGIISSFAIVLEKVLGTSAEMWVRVQVEYDL